MNEEMGSSYRFLVDYLRKCITRLDVLLAEDLGAVLQLEKRLLAPALTGVNGKWAQATYHLTRYLAPDAKEGIAAKVAVAVECLACALDLLDDVEDGDTSSSLTYLGQRRAINVSSALQALAHLELQSLSGCIPAERVLRILQYVNDMLIQATSGQHRDLLFERRNITVEESLEITAQKAGSLIQLVTVLPAILAETTPEIASHLENLGLFLGCAYQISNDCQDLGEQDGGHHILKTDLALRKQTLPVLLAVERGLNLDMFGAQMPAWQEVLALSRGVCLFYYEKAELEIEALENKLQRGFPPPLFTLLFGHPQPPSKEEEHTIWL